MKLISISRFLLILILPFLIFLIVADFAGFDENFYKNEFSYYNVGKNVPAYAPMHQKVMGFISGKGSELPQQFNSRERQHMADVRSIIRIFTIAMSVLVIVFILLLLVSGFILKANGQLASFIGEVLLYGGFLTIAIGVMLLALLNSYFSSSFESFHKLFFQSGTYSFDPAKEVIVNLYPEQMFMDLGIRISKLTLMCASAIILIGALMVFKSKKNK